MIETIIPKDEEHWLALRMQDITSTDVSALFGISPYSTHFELWHRKKRAEVVEFKENKRMKWGNALEASIANSIAEDKGWSIRSMKEYMRDTELRAGSSFDFSIEGEKLGILEIKNVDGIIYRNDWTDEQAPLHIEMQIQHQLMVSDREYAYLGALVGGNDEKLMFRKRDEVVISEMRKAIKSFWESIENNTPPSPDFKADAKFIAKLYGYAEPNKVFDARGNEELYDLAMQYKEFGDQERDAKKEKDAKKAEMLILIGDSEKVVGDGFSISAGIVSSADILYTRAAYRTFKVYKRKKK